MLTAGVSPATFLPRDILALLITAALGSNKGRDPLPH